MSVDGSPTLVLTVVEFTDSTYTTSIFGGATNTGTWTKSGSAYTLNGTFFGFIATSTTITPTFSNSSNTLTYTDGGGHVEFSTGNRSRDLAAIAGSLGAFTLVGSPGSCSCRPVGGEHSETKGERMKLYVRILVVLVAVMS